MATIDPSWCDAIFQGSPGLLIQQLLARLDSAENAELRATTRDVIVGHFLEARQNSQQLAVILDLIFRTKHREEFEQQLRTSQLCQELRKISDVERASDKHRRDADQRTACCTAIENWGQRFLEFASRHKWFDKEGTFWREARSASNRVPEWAVAKPMLDLSLLEVHLAKKDWEPMLEQGYLAMTRVTDLKNILPDARRLDSEIINALHLRFDTNGDINFSNWQEISQAVSLAPLGIPQSSTQDSPLSSHRSSITPPTSPLFKSSRQGKSSAAPAPRISKRATTGPKRAITKPKTRTVRTHNTSGTEKITTRTQASKASSAVKLARRSEPEAYLADCGHVERDKHAERVSMALPILRGAYDNMKSTLDEARDNASGYSMPRRDELFNFALILLQSPCLALEWNSNMCETLRERADIWLLKDSEAMDLVSTHDIIDKPIIVRGSHCQHPARPSWFFASLVAERGPKYTLDVQSNSDMIAQPRTLQELEDAIFQPPHEAGSRDFEPINCLKVPLIESQEGDPPFMCHPRYMIGDKVCRSLRKVAKSKRATSLLVDSRKFNLLSTALTVSKFHKDAFNCTWVKCLAGVKAWFFLKSDAEDQDYQDPDPKDLRVILLFPGDVLFMPAGLPVPHSVITVTGPCVMAGGQRLDSKCLVPQLNEIMRVMRQPQTTNEDLSVTELKSIMCDIIKQIEEQPMAFDDPQTLTSSISGMLSSLTGDNGG